MNKKLTVKQKHRYTHESHTIYTGNADYQYSLNIAKFSYIEDESGCKVSLDADENGMRLERKGADVHTLLTFVKNKESCGTVSSMYGTIDINIKTHKYYMKKDVIAVEYDILVNNEVTDGYCIIWNMREGLNE